MVAAQSCHMTTLVLTLAAFLGSAVSMASSVAPIAAPSAPAQARCYITHVANAGVLFESGSARFLIDAPIREGIAPYGTPSPDVSRQLEAAAAPFDRIAAILITHWHEDHFSADAIAAHLAANPAAVLISSGEVVARVRKVAPSLPDSRFRPSTPLPGTSFRIDAAGVPVHVLRIRHNPTRRPPEQHVGFLIEGCKTVLHTGDADPQADNFTTLKGLPAVDVGLLPFWYVLGEKSRAFVDSAIRPGRVLAIHIPPPDADDVSAKLGALTNMVPLTRYGQTVDLRR